MHGRPDTVSVTGPLKPAMGLIVIACDAATVGPTVCDVGVAVIGGCAPLGPPTVTEQVPVPVLPIESVTATDS